MTAVLTHAGEVEDTFAQPVEGAIDIAQAAEGGVDVDAWAAET